MASRILSRLAYYIAAHGNIDQFRWTFGGVYTPEDVFAIHVDAKSSDTFYAQVADLASPYPNVHLLPRRNVAWSGWSFCQAELAGLQFLLRHEWQHYINLSGQCYPIKSLDQIRATLADQWPRNFIRAWPFEHIAQTEPDDPHLRRPVVYERGGKIRYLRPHWRWQACWPKSRRVNWKGATWHILTREFCQWIFQSGRPLNRLPLSLKYTFCPDEILFQTLIMESPYRDTISDTGPDTGHFGREVIWPGPKILTLEDWPRLRDSPAFFARKFDCRRDDRILYRLEAENHGTDATLGAPVATTAFEASRYNT